MSKSLLKSALVGGLIVFVWGMISWMALPMHKHCFHSFKNESKVASVIRENAPEKGIYILPNTYGYNENSSQSEMNKAIEMMDKGPFMFASVVPNGLGNSMDGPLVFSFVIQVVGAFIISWMLSRTKGLAFWDKVKFVTLFGLGVGVLGLLPSWNWLGFPGLYVAVHLLDLIVGWFLAGMAIAKLLKIAK